jgi:ABC-type amino acid transport substrate-binding protein
MARSGRLRPPPGLEVRAVRSSGELARSLVAGESQAALVPMIVALHMQKSEAFRRLGLAPPSCVRRSWATMFPGISPRRPELKHEINTALERIKRNGTYDRINSAFCHSG